MQFYQVNPNLKNGGSWGNGGRVFILGHYGMMERTGLSLTLDVNYISWVISFGLDYLFLNFQNENTEGSFHRLIHSTTLKLLNTH